MDPELPRLTRRQLLAGGFGLLAAGATAFLLDEAWTQLGREDLIPGVPPDVPLEPQAWTTSADEVAFAVIGDNGSGGRQAMAVAEQLALSYRREPFGLLSMLGDIVYYGPIERRFRDVFLEPLGPLIDAGVGFEVALGNHDNDLFLGQERFAQVERELELLGTPARYYATTHGPVDLFYLDTVAMLRSDQEAREQVDWLDEALSAATSPWRVVCLHHPVYSSGRHGSTTALVDRLAPVLTRHRVDLVLSGHDHHYERTQPIDGVTYVISGGGCKLTGVEPSDFSAVAMSRLQFLRVRATRDRLEAHCVGVDGEVLDAFELTAQRP